MDQVIPSVPLAILGTIVVVVYGGLIYLLKYLLAEALPEREKEQHRLLQTIHDFYERQFKDEKEVCLQNYQKLQVEIGRITEVLDRLVSRLDGMK